ncbi:hypothetical protein EV700_1337 [Fluviicoccus keumensis]|uniref:Uncharacterized protein n=1 Tax=Fluviicoccus keumensis TaxID=1435465 RepID=A0A4Q7ZA51_9GAMM|nr:hypothetical protein [Fluviicoccus keumensis]RZU46951.1 hypothetical protein EV700_1337 [Fluviicoccus keumensis]
MKTARLILWVALATAGLSRPALAADPAADRLRDQVRQAVLEKRQLEDENFQLKAQLAAAQTEAAKAPKAAPAPKTSPEVLKLRETTREQNDRFVALQAELEGVRAELAQARSELAQTGVALKELQAVRLQQAGMLQSGTAREKICLDANGKLADLTAEVLGRYRQQDFWEALREHETVTGLYQVTLENLVQDYRHRMQDATLPPVPDAAPAPAEAINPASAIRHLRRPSQG